jgi:HEAT repeat protein
MDGLRGSADIQLSNDGAEKMSLIEKSELQGQIIIKKADVQGLLDEKDETRLIEVLKYGGTRAMQMDAAVALGTLGRKRAIKPLAEMIDNRYAWIDIRIYAVRSIGRIGGKEAVEALEEAAEYKDFHGSSEDVEAIRKAAKIALNSVSVGKKWWQFWK